MTRLEAAEMRFLRSVKGYTRLDKTRSEVIRKELEIYGIQDVRSKHKQNWINHLERMDNTKLPKHALNYKPRGRRDRGRPRKRWHSVDAGTGQTTQPMEEDNNDDDDVKLLHVSVTINNHQADISVHGHDRFSAYSMGSILFTFAV